MANRRNPSSCFPLLQNRAPMQHLTAVTVNLGTPHSEQTHGEIQRENTIPGRSRFQGYHLSAGKRTLPSSAGRHKPRTQHRGAASVGGRSWQGSHWAVTSWKEWKVRSTGGSALPGPARVMCTVKWGTARIHPESNPTAWTRAPLKGNSFSCFSTAPNLLYIHCHEPPQTQSSGANNAVLPLSSLAQDFSIQFIRKDTEWERSSEALHHIKTVIKRKNAEDRVQN